jgi:FkbM family methyltransferase
MLRFLLRFIVAKTVPRLRRYSQRPMFCVPGDHIGDSIFLDGVYEGSLLHSTFGTLLASCGQRFSVSTCLDVGANIGNHSLFFADRFSRVVAIEPNPVFCLAFRASVALNQLVNIQLIECGLGATAGRLAYQQTSATNLGGSHFVQSVEGSQAGMEYPTLEIKVGDEIIESLDIPSIALIKIDVEGFELAVLRGLQRTLVNQDPVVMFESHPEMDRENAEATLSFLRQLGYLHVYTCERQRLNPYSSRLRKVLFRLAHGWRERPTRVDTLEDREYLMLIAARRPLM